MNHFKYLFLNLMILAIILPSCKTVQVPKFTSIDNVLTLTINSTIQDVENKLGCKPYNIYSNQKDGYTIYVYKYKVLERNVNPKIVNKIGGETVGNDVYNGKENNLYLYFTGGKLESLITTDGRKDSNVLLLLNNTLSAISQDKGKYILVPTNLDDSKSNSTISFRKKK